MIYFQSLTQAELAELLKPLSVIKGAHHLAPEELELKVARQAKYRAQQIFHWVYQRYQMDWDLMSDLSKNLREWLKANIKIFQLERHTGHQALDGTQKFLWKLEDSKTIESVVIPAALQEQDADESEPLGEGKAFRGRTLQSEGAAPRWGRLTACISSQVGCAMGCKFCLTGVQGLDRNLQVHEIVTQVLELRKLAPITNIVFMGMGEPLHNFENVVKACQIFLDQDGLSFSKRKVTVSTSGLVPAIEELGKRVDVSLAISLNGSNNEGRSKIMPVNKKWDIEKLMQVCRSYPLGSHRRITFEYVLLEGMNDSLEDAARVVQLIRGIPSKINLIPFNEHPGSDFKRPEDGVIRSFQKFLLDRNITATVRISRGQDILAACGQLRSIFGTARGTEKHRDYVC